MHPIADCRRKVLPDDLAKVPGSREVMVQTTVGDQKDFSAGFLTVHNSADIDAGLANQKTAKLNDDLRFAQRLAAFRYQPLQVLGDGCQVEPCFAGKIGDAESAADIEPANRRRGVIGKTVGQLERLGLRLDYGCRVQVLGAAEDVEAAKIELPGTDVCEQVGYLLSINAEGLCAPPICMPEVLSSKSGLTRTDTMGRMPSRIPAAVTRAISPADSRLIMIPAATAASSSRSDLPGPAKLILAGAVPVFRAMCISPREATSNPSVSEERCWTTAGIGLALIA